VWIYCVFKGRVFITTSHRKLIHVTFSYTAHTSIF
jgi:hypothetical protein